MRKALFLILFFMSVSMLYTVDFNFRKSRWGMTSREVSRLETARFIKKINTRSGFQLLYQTTIGDMKGRVIYDFNRNKLVKARYVFVLYDVDRGINDYQRFRQLLVKKYGQPSFSRRILSGDNRSEIAAFSYLILPLRIRLRNGLKKGDITLKTSWNLQDTIIYLHLENKQDPELYLLTVLYENSHWYEEQQKIDSEREKKKDDALFKAL
jgi:hypothetical protein